MGRKLHFRPGSFYRVDDRSGFPQRAERTRSEWNNLIVADNLWEPRQPQDLVRGVKDEQSVPDPRSISPAVFIGPVFYVTAADAFVGATVLTLQTTAGLNNGDQVGVMLQSGEVFNTFVSGAPTPDDITLSNPLPWPVTSGSNVTRYGVTL